MASDPGCPIEVDVSCSRLVEGKGSVINLRLLNTSQDPEDVFAVEFTLEGDLFPVAVTASERLAPRQQRVLEHLKVQVPAATTICVVHVRVMIQDAKHGRFPFRGTFTEDVHPAGDGSSIVNYNISAANGSVIDASGVRIGDRAPTKAAAPAWRPVLLHADVTAETLSRCELQDANRNERLVIDVRRSLVIGRDGGDADVQVVDPARKISRSHCRIYFDAGAAWIEHLSRTNTTRLDGAEVAGRVRIPQQEVGMIVLAGAARLRLSPIASVVPVGPAAATNAGGRSDVKISSQTVASAVGGYLIEAVDPTNATARTLWLLGAVRASDALPRVKDRSLILASEPHLVRGQWSSGGSLVGTRPLRVQEQVDGWVVVG